MGRRQAKTSRRSGPGWGFLSLSLVVASISGLVTGFEAGTVLGLGAEATAERAPAVFAPPDRPSLVPTLEAPLNILVMATDVEYVFKDGKRVMGLRGRTDTMMLARLDPESDQVRILSIPRDTRVHLEGHGNTKINAANPYGGPILACQAVADLLGVTVDRYIVLNTEGVVQLVDALGGVNLYVQKPMHYDDWAGALHIHLKAGWNRLDGKAAHDYLRFRHDDAGDIGRIQRQQRFLEAVMTQYMTPANLLKTPALIAMAGEHIQTDLSADELVRLAGWGKDLTPQQVQMAMVPGRDTYIGGGWYWEPDVEAASRLATTFLTGEPVAEVRSPASYSVTIRDGVGDRAAVSALRAELAAAGYSSVQLGERYPDLGLGVTEIITPNADEAGARALASALGVGRVVVAATADRQTDFTIIVGQDWADRGKPQAMGR